MDRAQGMVVFYRVLTPFVVGGLYGCPGDVLTFQPAHPTHTVAIREAGRGRRRLRAHRHAPAHTAAQMVEALHHAGMIRPLPSPGQLARVEEGARW